MIVSGTVYVYFWNSSENTLNVETFADWTKILNPAIREINVRQIFQNGPSTKVYVRQIFQRCSIHESLSFLLDNF